MSAQSKSAVVMLSGGLDSATVLAIARSQGFRVSAATFLYGQRHIVEVKAAQRVAAHLGVERHSLFDIDLRLFGGSALTSDLDVPIDRTVEQMSESIPVTYVPARNTIFLSYALAFAEVSRAFDIFVGMNALDFAGYPDCRPEYVSAFERMANLATKATTENEQRIRIHAPLISMSKAEIIERGIELGVDYSMTSSCYAPSLDGIACGRCDACLLRLEGFRLNGLEDPVSYQSRKLASA